MQAIGTKYTMSRIEVHTSQDGEQWYRTRGSWKDTEKEKEMALKELQEAKRWSPYARLVLRESVCTVLDVFHNTTVATQQQTNELVERGTKALQGIPGISVTETMAVDMNTLQSSNTKVVVTFSPGKTHLGRRPKHGTPALKKWMADLEGEMDNVFDGVCVRLTAANIRYARHASSIELFKS